MSGKRETGQRGEQLAARHYEAAGYTVLERNYTSRFGEVDLILQKDGLYVFCEVKTRRTGALVSPAEAVDARKQRRVALAAQRWLQVHRLSDPLMRFDVAQVVVGPGGGAKVELIENAY